jgi:cell division protease FtsH
MNEKIGPVALFRETSPFLRVPGTSQTTEPLSPELASEVDKQVRQLLSEQSARAQKIIEEHLDSLEKMVERLLVEEIMSKDEFSKIAGEIEKKSEDYNVIKSEK